MSILLRHFKPILPKKFKSEQLSALLARGRDCKRPQAERQNEARTLLHEAEIAKVKKREASVLRL